METYPNQIDETSDDWKYNEILLITKTVHKNNKIMRIEIKFLLSNLKQW